MIDASVDAGRQNENEGTQIAALPLNLIARIVSWLEDPGDLARLCRTCRLLHYMSIPHLYRNISLTSYDRIRYRGEQPEGWGNASPFSMGLNTLVTRAHASLVESMTLRGEWNEPELEGHSRVGRVPDSSMMLNITVRAALDRTKNIESFSWELNTKMLETVYLGLLQLPKLTSLSIRFPTSRHPRPIYAIPAMPHLRCLKVTDIDPLCYPDDISTLLAKSPHLQELTMHWSPRMRESQEPSVTFHDYFRHCIKDKRPLKLKKLAFYNMYARNSNEWKEAIDHSLLEDVTSLVDLDGQDPTRNLTFLDKTWSGVRPQLAFEPRLKSIRHDLMSKDACEFLSSFKGLEKLYCVNFTHATGYKQKMRLLSRPSHQVVNGKGSIPTSTVSGNASTIPPSSPRSPASNITPLLQLRDTYFNTIITNHGPTLRHLVLPSRWPLSIKILARLAQVCPNLEQLSMAPEISTLESLGLLIPFLRNLQALRILSYPTTPGQSPAQSSIYPPSMTVSDIAELDENIHAEKISAVLADRNRTGKIKIVGFDWHAWELGDFYYIPASSPGSSQSVEDAQGGEDSTSTGSLESPLVNTPVGELPRASRQQQQQPQQQNLLSAVNTSVSKSPSSLLGKRTRDEASPPPIESPSRPPSLLVDSDNVYDTLPSGEKVMWRRQLRPATWDVLKKWEIWALDSQD